MPVAGRFSRTVSTLAQTLRPRSQALAANA
jgi:hypothetical protein